jgi:multisubunit Na+/H+ antiporter MnhB subunit
MKTFNGIISVLLGLLSMYLMFIWAKTDMDFVCGFLVLIMAALFLLFMIIEERNEEISQLRRTILKMRGIE